MNYLTTVLKQSLYYCICIYTRKTIFSIFVERAEK